MLTSTPPFALVRTCLLFLVHCYGFSLFQNNKKEDASFGDNQCRDNLRITKMPPLCKSKGGMIAGHYRHVLCIQNSVCMVFSTSKINNYLQEEHAITVDFFCPLLYNNHNVVIVSERGLTGMATCARMLTAQHKCSCAFSSCQVLFSESFNKLKAYRLCL